VFWPNSLTKTLARSIEAAKNEWKFYHKNIKQRKLDNLSLIALSIIIAIFDFALVMKKIFILSFDRIKLHKNTQKKTLIYNRSEKQSDKHCKCSICSSNISKHIYQIVGFSLVRNNCRIKLYVNIHKFYFLKWFVCDIPEKYFVKSKVIYIIIKWILAELEIIILSFYLILYNFAENILEDVIAKSARKKNLRINNKSLNRLSSV
jgi:hypothetical protein